MIRLSELIAEDGRHLTSDELELVRMAMLPMINEAMAELKTMMVLGVHPDTLNDRFQEALEMLQGLK